MFASSCPKSTRRCSMPAPRARWISEQVDARLPGVPLAEREPVPGGGRQKDALAPLLVAGLAGFFLLNRRFRWIQLQPVPSASGALQTCFFQGGVIGSKSAGRANGPDCTSSSGINRTLRAGVRVG